MHDVKLGQPVVNGQEFFLFFPFSFHLFLRFFFLLIPLRLCYLSLSIRILLAKLRCPGCPFIQRNSFSWHNPLADPLAQKCNGGTSMAFLQICRRHQKLFEGASASVKLLLTRKGFQSCRILHSHESKHPRVGKKDYSFPCVKKYAPGSREMFLVLIRDNQKIMKIKNNNNQLSDEAEAEAECKLNNLAGRGWFISTPMRLSDVLRKIE